MGRHKLQWKWKSCHHSYITTTIWFTVALFLANMPIYIILSNNLLILSHIFFTVCLTIVYYVTTSVDLGKRTLLQCQLIFDMITKSFCVLKACLNSSKKILFFFAKKRKKYA